MILITGASSGIGKSCAEEFAKKGHPLILVARRKQRLEEIAKNLKKYKVEVHYYALDIRNKKDVEAFAKKHAPFLEKTKILINNAGLAKGVEPIQSGKTDDWDAMIDTNLKGLLYMTKAVLPFFLKKKLGHIVNIGSVAGYYNYPNGNVYCATKHAVRSLNEAMRMDLLGTGIRVTEIAAGMVDTEFSTVRLGSHAKAKKVYEGMVPLKAEDIAKNILWVCDQPAHINIQSLMIYPTDQAAPGLVHRKVN